MDIDCVQEFVDASRQLTEPQQLHGLLDAMSRDLGFDYFALLHRIDLPLAGSKLDELNQSELVALSNYPDEWIQAYIDRNLVEVDPVILASMMADVGFRWSEVPDLIEMTPTQLEIWDMGREAGIADGFTVPARIVGRGAGSCNFAVGPATELPRANFLMAEIVGIHSFHAARKIVEHNYSDGDKLRLSPRQRDCIELVGRGKTDWEIAQILGISPATVKDHIDDARRKYGVSKRVQIVLRAAFEGQIQLASILR